MKTEADWARYMPIGRIPQRPETTPEADLLTYIYCPRA